MPRAAGRDRTRAMRVRHLASMATGRTFDTFAAVLTADPDDPVRVLRVAVPFLVSPHRLTLTCRTPAESSFEARGRPPRSTRDA